ncbi:MAG: ParB/RepB/Spo0J family partition protein [Hyphomicrobiaceae bacterium]
MYGSYEPHPLAEELPLIEGAEFDELVASIKRDGLITPILLADGKVLDGRNRLRACIAAKVQPRFDVIDETDPRRLVEMVMAANLHRRHLSDAQRAMIAGRLNALRGLSVSDAMKTMGVSGRRTVQKASVIARHGSAEDVEAVERGQKSVHSAYQATIAAKRGPGRPIGNASVNALRRVLVDLEPLIGKQSTIVLNWPGDPGLNMQIAKASKFFASLARETREQDHAEPAFA